MTLQAGKTLIIAAGKNQKDTTTNTSSSSSSVGVSSGTKGTTLDIAASRAKGESQQSSTQYQESQINAANKLTIQTGGDTELVGAQLRGKQIVADIDGDLTITSQQDTSTYTSEHKQQGFSASIPLPGADKAA